MGAPWRVVEEHGFSLEPGALWKLTTNDNNVLSTYCEPATLLGPFQKVLLWSEWLPGSPQIKWEGHQAWETVPMPEAAACPLQRHRLGSG